MKKMRIFKLIQLILAGAGGIAGFVLIFRRTAPQSMNTDLVPMSALFVLFIACLSFNLVCLFVDMILLSGVEAEKQKLDKLSYIDPVTGGLNRLSTDMLSAQYDTPEKLANSACFIFRITNLVEINKTRGYKEGDRLLRMFYALLEMAARDSSILTRNPPDIFIVYYPEAAPGLEKNFPGKIAKSVNDYNVDSFDLPIEYAAASAVNREEKKQTVSELIACAIAKLD